MTHLIDDKAVAKMGHPIVVVRSDVGHPSQGVGSNGVFSDFISTNACVPPDTYTCGYTLAPDQWQYCPSGRTAVTIASPTYVVNESSVSVDGTTASQQIGSTVPK
jgi:hypothetical protein